MAMVNSNRFNFAEVVEKYLLIYQLQCVEAMTEAIKEVSGEAVKQLKSTAPGKDYPTKWTRKLDTGRFTSGAQVYSKKPGLPHLLEYGHLMRNGKRSNNIVHIAPVERWAISETIDRVIKKMEAIS